MLDTLQQSMGYTFADVGLLCLALTHKSAAQDAQLQANQSFNQRLEYLGDALLDFAIADYLYRAHPDWDVGTLTTQRANLVSNAHLAELYDKLGLGDYIRAVGLSTKDVKVRADFVECIVGAVYMDGGFDCAVDFVKRHLLYQSTDTFDYVSNLLHLFRVQYIGGEVLDAEDIGTTTAPQYRVRVVLDDATIGVGEAKSKANARKIACKQAYLYLEK